MRPNALPRLESNDHPDHRELLEEEPRPRGRVEVALVATREREDAGREGGN